jgi:membrane protein YqaA with SNARE-associated domain
MKNNKNLSSPRPLETKVVPSKIRTLTFVLEIVLIIVLLAVWFSSESIRESKNLWIFFFYSFPAEFLIAIVPHEPVLLYFSKFYSPLAVTLVGIAGTVLAEMINYSVFKYVGDLKRFNRVRHTKWVSKTIDLFNKAPFVALLVAGFTPVPFYPFRFLVVLARYPLPKYILAIFLSRTPRFYLLALLGHIFKIPDYLFPVIFIALAIPLTYPLVRSLLKKQGK